MNYAVPLLLLLATLLPAGAHGQEAEEPVATFYSTATVRERPLSSATGAVSVLDREAIEASGARTTAELLRFVPGLDVTSNGTRGGLTTAQIRGGDPNFTLVLLDGVPLNDATYQVGDVFDLEGLPALAVERIEIVRGPLSSFYGSTGLAGVINIVTRQGRSGAPAVVEAEIAAGDASMRQAGAAVSGSLGAAAYFVGGTWEEERERIADERFEQGNVHANLSAPFGRARLRLRTRYASRQADDYPDASGGPRFGSGELRQSDHEEASLGSEVLFGGAEPERHKLTLALYRHDLDRTSPAIGFAVPESIEATRYTVARAGWSSVLVSTGGLRLSAGADVQREEGKNRSVLFLPPDFGGEVRGDYEITRTLPGAYAELIAERGNVVIEAGSRFDAPEDRGFQWSPRLGVSWRPGGGPTRWHASAGHAWKQPSFFALASPPQLGGNPDLEPEKVLGGDLGVERDFAARGFETGVTLFYNRYDDLIDFDFETFRHLNRSQVEARGVEWTLGWKPADRLSVHANATWQQVKDVTTQAKLRHRPKWVGGARLDWRPATRFDLQLDFQAVSQSFDEQIPVPDRETVSGYGVAGLAGSWRLSRSWRLRGRIDNLADRRYETLIGFPGPGRSFRLGLRYGS
jgi:iron complex outermembrane receptor protein/vitamin B12 transporter